MAPFWRKLRAAERDPALEYYRAALTVTALQDREADRYNRALMIHMNSMDDPTSVGAMVAASKRLSKCAHELIARHAVLWPVPDIELVASDYAAWASVYYAYAAWADAQHDVFLTLSAGKERMGIRVQQLMTDAEASRERAEKASRPLLQAIGLKSGDIQQIMMIAHSALKSSDWQPADEE